PPAGGLITLSTANGKEGWGNNLKLLLYFLVPSIIEICRELRRLQTPAEKILWDHLRNRKLAGHKFLRQHPVCVESRFGRSLYYIPDFYCHTAKLVIEADGPIHQFKKEYDKTGRRFSLHWGLIF